MCKKSAILRCKYVCSMKVLDADQKRKSILLYLTQLLFLAIDISSFLSFSIIFVVEKNIARVKYPFYILKFQADDFYVEMKWEFSSWGRNCVCLVTFLNCHCFFLSMWSFLVIIHIDLYNTYANMNGRWSLIRR